MEQSYAKNGKEESSVIQILLFLFNANKNDLHTEVSLDQNKPC